MIRDFFIAALLMAVTAPASAQSRDCRSNNPDTAIAGCTADIVRATPLPMATGMLPAYYSLRAAAYQKKDMLKEAKADLDTVVVLSPGFRAHFNRAAFLSDYGSEADALSDYTAAITAFESEMRKDNEEEPFYGQANFQVAEILRRRERFSDALLSYDKAITIKPDDRQILFNRSLAYSRLENFDAVIAGLAKVVEKDGPYYVSGVINRGMAYFQKGDFPSAMADMDKAVAKEPDSPVVRVRRALVLERIGQRDKAIGDYREALKLFADMKEAKDGLARLAPGDRK